MNEPDPKGPMLGPVDIVVIGYPPGAPMTGETSQVVVDLVERGIINVLDVRGIKKEMDGSFSGFDITDVDADGIPDLVTFRGAQTGLIGDQDTRVAAEGMEPGSAGVMIVFENTWAAPFVSAVFRNGGHLIAYERIGAEDLLEAVEALDATDSTS